MNVYWLAGDYDITCVACLRTATVKHIRINKYSKIALARQEQDYKVIPAVLCVASGY